MDKQTFEQRLHSLRQRHDALLGRRNEIDPNFYNGLYDRYKYPVVTAAHAPLEWRYDLNPETNPHLMERIGVNGVYNVGAMEWNGKIILACRVEGMDRKSYFAIAESETGVDGFRFWETPITMPETDVPDTNVYDMRLTKHEDGYIYGVFCTERKDPKAAPGDLSAAVAQAGIARTKDLITWERLPDLKSRSPQQRNVVLHPEFVDGQYAFYTRPQDDFIQAGSGGGIGWALSPRINGAVTGEERIIDERVYHTIKEVKNGQGPTPIKTPKGWLNVAHGVRGTAAGLRYVLYAFLSDLNEPWKVTHRPGGYLLAPEGEERVGDVSNVAFSNGMVARENGDLFIYYGSSDTRTHVVTTTVEKMLDYVINTPEDGYRSAESVKKIVALVKKNQALGM